MACPASCQGPSRKQRQVLSYRHPSSARLQSRYALTEAAFPLEVPGSDLAFDVVMPHLKHIKQPHKKDTWLMRSNVTARAMIAASDSCDMDVPCRRLRATNKPTHCGLCEQQTVGRGARPLRRREEVGLPSAGAAVVPGAILP